MQTKPIFIGLAAGILVLVVAAASFTAGIYSGKSGAAAQAQNQAAQGGPGQGGGQNGPRDGGQQFGGGPRQGGQNSPQGGGQNGPRSGQPSQNGFGPQAPAGAPSWPFTYENRDGTAFSIAFDASTKFIDAEGAEITVSDLQVGDVIAVFGTDVATTIMQMPPKPNAPVSTPTAQPTP